MIIASLTNLSAVLQLTIVGARLYLMHDICHDFSDADCQQILRHTTQSIAPDSRLLIHDWVVRDVNPQSVACMVDWNMLLYLKGAKERSLKQWQELLNSVGLDIVQVWSADFDAQSVIETRLKQ